VRACVVCDLSDSPTHHIHDDLDKVSVCLGGLFCGVVGGGWRIDDDSYDVLLPRTTLTGERHHIGIDLQKPAPQLTKRSERTHSDRRRMLIPSIQDTFLAFLLVFPTVVSSFVGRQNGWVTPRNSHAGTMKLFSSGTDTTERNMFHDYDKPILLVGYSSDGDELNKVASSFLSDNFPNVDDATIVLPSDDLVNSIEEYSWPSLIVVDFSSDLSLESKYSEMVQTLYADHGLLSIHVNVMAAKMPDDVTDRKLGLDGFLIQNSDYELCIQDEGSLEVDDPHWEHVQWEFSRLIARSRMVPAVPGAKEPTTNTAHLTMGENAFFLSLSFPEISEVEPYVEQMCLDVDAMEYRTDLLKCRDSRFDLIYGMQLLRRYCRPHVVRVPALPFGGQILEDVMPIVYTVRTQNQAGTYPDDEAGISKMFDMLEWGLRGGVEVLDVESAWDKEKTESLLTKAETRYASQILGSHHVVGEEIATDEAVRLFQQCALDGRAHGAKVVLSIDSNDKDRMAHEAALIASALAEKEQKPVIPNISLILGDVGKFSRIINFPFTPVTHESLPFKAAPGQMSASEIMAARVLMKIVESKRYAILGHNIAYSVSPQMQGTAFEAARLPHQYGLADVETVEEFVESDFFKAGNFGGCSVTIPHKQAIIPYVDVLSDAASTIGSVNTLIVRDEIDGEAYKRVIYGDNTDWKGIFNPLERKVGVQSGEDFALILGGGGTARAASYAASKLGLKRLYYNRTPAKAADLAESFGGQVLNTLDETGDGSLGDSLSAGGSLKVVISTLPAAAEFVLPEWLVASGVENTVIFDVNYKPYHTKLLTQAEEVGCDVVRGSEMLWEQGVGQFEAWTQRTAPYAVMKAVVLQNCLPEEL
jgi:shikimate-5-dehydrogenase/3-dehydroquinate dehydratase type I